MDKRSLTERDICTKFILPAVKRAGWDEMVQVREEVYFTKGRIIVRGKLVTRGKAKKADFVLYYKPNIPIALIEAKDNSHSVGDGMQQALDYAETLKIPFVFSSNGDGFVFHDRTGASSPRELNLGLDAFPSPADLWARYRAWKGLDGESEEIVLQDYHDDGSGKEPRYYQVNAVNAAIEAIAKGQDRVLLVMATGTGKTYTAFQIIWRLWKARRARRILFLADRNILVDQTRINDFKPFGPAMTKITNRTVDKSYEIYLSLYQAVTGTEEEQNIYREFSPDFFDLVVVDECHRGSAAADSAWREILEYFSSATHIGLTATPKETKEVSNIDYFGEPVYTYSLKQGIEDGFLAPFKVVRIDIDKDLVGWRPEQGQCDRYGEEIEDRVYNQRDMDRALVLSERTRLVAKRITEFLKSTDRFAKTIVFCEDIDHAERMRQELVNANADLAADNPRYVVRITGDSPEGKAELDYFIDPESTYPVIATTSKLLSTGVDAQTCKVIVLDQRIESMTEFKQIIGRGTRIREDYGKYFFTIIDLKKATELFADPAFDGEPVSVYDPDPGTGPGPGGLDGGDEGGGDSGDGDDEGHRIKYYVDDVPVWIVGERVQYYGKDGRLITESLKDYTRRAVAEEYESLDDFLRKWSEAEKKSEVIDTLVAHGVLFDALAEEVGRDYDAFDLICHVAFGQPPLTRKERADQVRRRDYFTRYGEQARAVLEALLDKYADGGIENIEDTNVLRVQPLSGLGTPLELLSVFGGRQEFGEALADLERQLYA
jgi:type I restriction enzyme R subunit